MDLNNFNIHHTQYNFDKTSLFCSTNKGFIIYNINPFRQLLKRNIKGGISYGVIYQRSNIIFFVGTGISPEYPTNCLIIWDEKLKKKIAQITIKNKIEGFKINEYNIQVWFKKNVYIYGLMNLAKLKEISIISYSFSSIITPKGYLICFPSIDYKNLGKMVIKSNNSLINVQAHKDSIHKLALSPDGKYIATCSSKGYLLKLFNNKGILIREYNRGFTSKQISFLGFSTKSRWLICATEYSTIHLFDLENEIMPLTFFRERSRYTYNINEIVIDCYINDDENKIIFNSLNKIYTGYFSNNKIIINHTYLLMIEKDPFSFSPKLVKKNIGIK